MKIIGHRGASYNAPENTIASAKLAFENRADGIEIDIRMTGNNKIVVFHDENTSRLSSKSRKIATNTLEQLKTIDIGEWKGPQWKGTHIATLEEMLAEIPPKKKTLIEFKCDIGAIGELKKLLDVFNRNQDIAIVSFDLRTLKLAKQKIPEVDLYWIHDLPELDSYLTDWIIDKSLKEGIKGLMFSESTIDEDIIQAAQEVSLDVYSWTINSAVVARQFAKWGLNGIITDRPGWLRNQLKLTISM